MGIKGLNLLISEDDGYTSFIVDLQSGTYVEADKCVIVCVPDAAIDGLINMSDSARVEWAITNGRNIIDKT